MKNRERISRSFHAACAVVARSHLRDDGIFGCLHFSFFRMLLCRCALAFAARRRVLMCWDVVHKITCFSFFRCSTTALLGNDYSGWKFALMRSFNVIFMAEGWMRHAKQWLLKLIFQSHSVSLGEILFFAFCIVEVYHHEISQFFINCRSGCGWMASCSCFPVDNRSFGNFQIKARLLWRWKRQENCCWWYFHLLEWMTKTRVWYDNILVWNLVSICS